MSFLLSLSCGSAVDLRKESVPNGSSHSANYFCTISMAAFPFYSLLGVSIAASEEQRELIIMLHRMVNTHLLYHRPRREAGSPNHLKPHTHLKPRTRRATHANNIVPCFSGKRSPSLPARASLRDCRVLLGDSAGMA